MADIRVERKHGKTKDEARAIALKIAERARDKAQVTFTVHGDVIDIERSGGKGKLLVTDDTVAIEINLPFLLKPMRSVLEGKIEEYFERYFK
jgi:putative polyhydroxyalkanoate system protein